MAPNEVLSSTDQQFHGVTEARTEKARLLLAEDNPVMRNQVCAMLEEEFDIVAAVADGETVLQEFRELEPDALILDISMGEMSGLEVARHLREQGNVAPVIFLTVHQEPDFVKAALSCGGAAYVVKSHLATDLVPAIKAALSGELFISPCLLHFL